ncbi:MAG TPA: hypothetical protein VGP04_02025 [Pseudonocardiaceae bacterium]|nr:hypothetical protein [Pseudonocardiaceae bacterium]
MSELAARSCPYLLGYWVMPDWAELDPERLERVAQLLVREACGATSVDGQGGDLAQDLRHDGPDGLTIYEVKSFTKRLNGSRHRGEASGSPRWEHSLNEPGRPRRPDGDSDSPPLAHRRRSSVRPAA